MKTQKLTGISILVAIIIVLQLFATFIPTPLAKITLTLIPIVIGGAIYGVKIGAFLGGVFGAIVFLCTLTGFSGAFSSLILQKMPLQTIALMFGKGILAGFTSAALFALIKKKSVFAASVVAAAVCPVINTGVYCLFMIFVFKDIFLDFAGGDNIYMLLLSMIGVNFCIEFVVNTALSSIIYRVISIRKR